MRLWANRRKSRDDEKPRHGSDRRGSYRFPSAPFLRCWAGTRAVKSPSNVPKGGSDSDGVCLVRSRRNDGFFCDLEDLVPSHPIGCIVEKTGAVLHCIKCT